MAQQASPKVAPQTEDFRDQLTSFSTEVSRIPAGSFSSIPMLSSSSVPIQTAAPPDVGVRDKDRDDEQDHLHEAEDGQHVEGHRPRVQEDDLDVEDNEEHRCQV